MWLPAREIWVDVSRPDDSGNGLTLATAKKTITGVSGLDTIWGHGDLVHIMSGTYPDVGVTISVQLYIVGHGRPLINPATGHGIAIDSNANGTILRGLNTTSVDSTTFGVHSVGAEELQIYDCVCIGIVDGILMASTSGNTYLYRSTFKSGWDGINFSAIEGYLYAEGCTFETTGTDVPANSDAFAVRQNNPNTIITLKNCIMLATRNDAGIGKTTGITVKRHATIEGCYVSAQQDGAGTGDIVGILGTIHTSHANVRDTTIVTANSGGSASNVHDLSNGINGEMTVHNVNYDITKTNGIITHGGKGHMDAINTEINLALDTVVPASPTSDSINERIKTLNDEWDNGGRLDLLLDAAIAGSVTASQAPIPSGGSLIIHRGDTFSQQITGLGDLTGWTNLRFTVKNNKLDVDSSSVLQILVTNPTGGGDGLITLEGTTPYATLSHGNITVDDLSGGKITIDIDEIATKLLTTIGKDLAYDIQMNTTNAVKTLTESTLKIDRDVTVTH